MPYPRGHRADQKKAIIESARRLFNRRALTMCRSTKSWPAPG